MPLCMYLCGAGSGLYCSQCLLFGFGQDLTSGRPLDRPIRNVLAKGSEEISGEELTSGTSRHAQDSNKHLRGWKGEVCLCVGDVVFLWDGSCLCPSWIHNLELRRVSKGKICFY